MKIAITFRVAGFAGCVAAMLGVAGCAGVGTGSNMPAATSLAPSNTPMPGTLTSGDQTLATPDLSQVSSWALFAGPTSVGKIAQSSAGLIVVAPDGLTPSVPASSDGSVPANQGATDKGETLADEVTAIRGKRTVRILALVDIASIDPSAIPAGDPRWNAAWVADGKLTDIAPAWLETPAAAGLPYGVRYWDRDYRKRLQKAVDALRMAGFDGVCLSGCDLYKQYAAERPTSAADMSALVQSVSHDARRHSSTFSIISMDSASLVETLSQTDRADYLKSVDGVVAQNVFYQGDEATAATAAPSVQTADLTPSGKQDPVLDALDRCHAAGKAVFVMDSPSTAAKAADFLAQSKAHGYVAYNPATPAADTSPTPSAGMAPNG